MDERFIAQDDEPLNDGVEQQNLPLEQPAVNRPNNQSLKPGAVPIGKLSILMAIVALLIALFIGILLGGGVPDEVVRNNTVLQAQIKQMSLALEKQGDQINELANTINTVQYNLSSIYDTINRVFRTQYQSTLFTSLQSVSCKDIKAAHPSSPTGYYYPNGRMVYCNMDKLCDFSGGWTRLAHLDMSDETQNCPSGFQLYQFANRRVCGRPDSNGGSCVSVKFPTNGISYSAVCGRVVGHARATPDALYNGNPQHNNLNSFYVDGVSITRGSPRQHVWTFAATAVIEIIKGGICNCPCSPGSAQKVPPFIGDNYYCEGGSGDPLWDGRDCENIKNDYCCSSPSLPWFHRQYNTSTTDHMELRVCADQETNDEDVPISFYDIYVQ